MGVGRMPVLRAAGEGEAFAAAGFIVTFKAVGAQTLGAYTLSELEVAPGAVASHRHARFAEAIYVLDGALTVRGDGRAFEAAAGSLVVVPPGATHAIANPGKAARVLSMTVPSGIEDYYRAAGRPVFDRAAVSANAAGDIDRLASLGALFGVDVSVTTPEADARR